MKKVLSTVATGVTIAALATSTAFAWTYNLTGKGACQPDGSYQITWSVDNSQENEAFHIKSSSNTAVVPLGDVPAKTTKDYKQTVDGTKAASYTLSLSGNWNSDQTMQDRSATVKLDTPCEQPGGKGGETPETPVTTTVAPTVVPVGAVNAGEGSASSSMNLAAVTALAVSVLAIAIGVIRRVASKA